MPEIKLYFPTTIYAEGNLFDSEQNKVWADKILELENDGVPNGGYDWEGDTYTTHGTYDLLQDRLFDPLLGKIQTHVDALTTEFNSDYQHTCKTAWGNVNRPGTYQEFHSHPSSVFSAVYYPKVPEGSGDIIFESPLVPDMMPILGIKKINDLSLERIWYTPEEGMLIIFRSFIKHSVRVGTNVEPRVSIALNYA
jgi:uncharacterized protein (TIGR02466 family)